MLFKKELSSLIDNWILPADCIGCGEENGPLCKICTNQMSFIGSFFCPICNKHSKLGEVCLKHKSPLKYYRAVGYYGDSLLQKLIKTVKYQGYSNYTKSLQEQMAVLQKTIPDYQNRTIITVPSDKRALSQRGFNPIDYWAKNFITSSTCKVKLNLLMALPKVSSQVGLGRANRQKNVEGRFVINKKVAAHGVPQKVILIDDVYTTGATLAECAKVLKRAGVKDIAAFTIAYEMLG